MIAVNELPALSIVGPGRVGTAIGVLAAEAAWPVIAIGGRDRDKTTRAARRIGDAYCLGVLPQNGDLPASSWDFRAGKARDAGLSLDDTGLPIIQGLILLYAVESSQGSQRAATYR